MKHLNSRPVKTIFLKKTKYFIDFQRGLLNRLKNYIVENTISTKRFFLPDINSLFNIIIIKITQTAARLSRRRRLRSLPRRVRKKQAK